MQIYVQDVAVQMEMGDREMGHYYTVRLGLKVMGKHGMEEFLRSIRPGAMLAEFAVGTKATKQTQVAIGGRKLALD
jgi:hypothetical protein